MTDFREGNLFAPPPIREQPRKCPSWIGLKWLNLLPSPVRLTQNKPNVNRVKRKKGYVHLTNLPNYRQGFSKKLQKSIFVESYFCRYFHGFGEEPFNLQESVLRKFVSLRCICRNESLFIRIILNIWQKLTFLFQLLSTFRENVILPMNGKSTISRIVLRPLHRN